MFGWTKGSRRRRLIEQPVTNQDRLNLSRSLWQTALLAPEDQDSLAKWIRVFVSEKNWEGCEGLVVGDAMKHAIAAAAGLMVLRHAGWYYDHTTTILIYPRPYVATVDPKFQNARLGGEFARAGETIYRGPVVVNWEDIRRSAKHANQGHHLVIHEFAHQLDMINGPNADGLPPLPSSIDEQAWRTAMHDEYVAARRMVEQGYHILMDDYGLTEESEFFAVASELYFQVPNELSEFHPNVFQLLKQFYEIDLRSDS
jgi:Mlc titration factor MtfA (ptsG expression regulator)